MGLGGVISNLLSLGAKLLPAINDSTLKVSSSSSSLPPADQHHKLEAELEALMRMLERIKATLHDAEQREIREKSVELWLKELKGVAYDAEDILDEYHYEVLCAQVEARHACPPVSRKRKLIQVPDGMFDQIHQIRNRFSEIEKDRTALRLSKADGPMHCNNQSQIAPTSHIIDASSIFGRNREKDKLINMLCFEAHDDQVVSVITIVGTGGIGKTTLAQITYNDKKVRERFDKFGWVCVSEEFNVERLTGEFVESITQKTCGFTNLGALQVEIIEAIRGKRILLVLDDVWNEKRSLWELFQAPLRSAAHVKILVTTRSENVAQIMQTEPTFYLGYLSEEQCWRLFEYYAFGRVNQSMHSNFIEVGEKIMKKCGMLPLAVKSIASLLRHELNEESWREILESELWETDASNEIFPPLQLSYTHLPTYLKPCLIFCSMFPKGFKYDIQKLVQLWICQGYVESKGKKSAQEIGWEYANQLWQRSLFESRGEYGNKQFQFRLHDIIHDMARLNSKKGCYSIEACASIELPDFNELRHLCIAGSNKPVQAITFEKFTILRTFIMMGHYVAGGFGILDLSMIQKLRVLEIDEWNVDKLKYFSLLGNLKHLRYLSLGYFPYAYLPESICSLYNLQNLKLMKCPMNKLPANIGNLVSLEQLDVRHCYRLKQLPESLCQLKALKELILNCCIELEELPTCMGSLTNLETFKIDSCEVHSLPSSCSKFIGIQTLHAMLECETIGWLKHFVDLGGTLYLALLKNISNLADVKCANLVSMQSLKCLELCWGDYDKDINGNGFWLYIKNQNMSLEDQKDYAVMADLQPHPNLTELRIHGYACSTYPEWIGNPNLCASLERIVMRDCQNLTVLPFGSLRKLKYLSICGCNSLWTVSAESLPLVLEELHIEKCRELVSVPGIRELKLLVKLNIADCENLHLLVMDAESCIGPMLGTNEFPYHNSVLGLRNLTSLKSLHIGRCPKLQLLEDEQISVESCEVDVCECPLLREWCLQHGINYKDSFSE